MILGITGHQKLDDPAGWAWVRTRLGNILRNEPHPVQGVTSLAVGADQLFADLVLRYGGILKVIVPFEDYDSKFKEGNDRKRYYRLLGAASEIQILQNHSSDEDAYLEAGKRVVDEADKLVAVWDGKPAEGLGGTADIFDYAKHKGKPIIHINPVTRTVLTYSET